jgi:hypothetical protein
MLYFHLIYVVEFMSGKSENLGIFAKTMAKNLDNYQFKTDAIGWLKQMKAKALTGDPISAYRVAQAYPRHSRFYAEWIKRAADSGLTNAMLDLAIALSETNAVGNLQHAASYLVRILRSNDSFIKAEAQNFLAKNRGLSVEVSRQMSGNKFSHSAMSFFSSNTGKTDDEQKLAFALAMK